MNPPVLFELAGQKCWLSAERCLYWEQQSILILSDLHFGKTGHFRKSGIAVPQEVYKEDLHRLFEQIQYFQPKEIIITGFTAGPTRNLNGLPNGAQIFHI
jgi:uncharacterized protein